MCFKQYALALGVTFIISTSVLADVEVRLGKPSTPSEVGSMKGPVIHGNTIDVPSAHGQAPQMPAVGVGISIPIDGGKSSGSSPGRGSPRAGRLGGPGSAKANHSYWFDGRLN